MSAKRKAVEAKPLELAIVVEGKIIESNFSVFREDAEKQIEAINFSLITDEDFDQADVDAKGLKRFEDMLSTTKAGFLRQMKEVNTLLESVDGLAALARKARLELQKRVENRKAEIREGIIRDGLAALEIPSREFTARIQEAIKGKKALAKMQEAVTEVVQEINAGIGSNRITLQMARAEHGDGIAYTESDFLTLAPAAAKVEMERRIERHRAALKEAEQKAEIERLRKEAEEKARQERLAEQARVETERAKEQAAQPEPAPAPAVAPAPTVAPAPAVAPAGPQAMREETAEEEMETFLTILRTALAPVKAARAALKHPANIEAAKHFAVNLNESFGKLLAN